MNAAKTREQRLEHRIDKFEQIYEDIVACSTELVHYLESHSEHSYDGPLKASDLALEDDEAEESMEYVLDRLEGKKTSYNQMKGFLNHQLTRDNDPRLRAKFERQRWEAERYIHHRVEPITEDLDSA